MVLFGCLTKLGATNAPDPSHWTLNSCFRTFHTILVHLGPFHCHTKLGANRAELVQKIVPRSRDGIFRNKRTRLNPFEPKLMFWCVSYYLGAFILPYNTKCKTGQLVQLFVPQSRVGIFRNERTRSTPFVSKLMFWRVSYHLGAFGTAWRHYESRYEAGRTRAKVLASKSRRNGSQRTHPIHPIGP